MAGERAARAECSMLRGFITASKGTDERFAAQASDALVADALLRTDYDRWPEALRARSIRPLVVRDVAPVDLAAFLGARQSPAPSLWSVPNTDGAKLFPKIAVCSWKCFPWLVPAPPGFDLFPFCSRRMRTVLSVWAGSGSAAQLRFFPFLDHCGVDEFRFELRGGRRRLARCIARTPEEDRDRAKRRAMHLLDEVAATIDDVVLDIAARGERSGCATWIVEMNPLQEHRDVG